MDKLKRFGEILKKVDKNKVTNDFWEKEKESFKEIEEKYIIFEKSKKMTHEKLHKEFDI